MTDHHAYLTRIRDLIHDPSNLDATNTEWFPAAPTSQAGLKFYVRAARNRRWRYMGEIFSILMRALTQDQQSMLHERFLAAPYGTDPDWFRNAGDIVEHVEALVQDGQLPTAAHELANHEWTLFTVALTRDLPPTPKNIEAAIPNPSLEIFQFTHDWLSWLTTPWPQRPTWPATIEAPITLAYLLHPETFQARWVHLDPSALAALAIVSEQIPLDAASAQTGLDRDALVILLSSYTSQGLFVASA